MTDSTDDDDRRLSDPTVDAVSDVPADTNWQLEIQVPFDEDESHDLTSAIIVAVAETEGVAPSEVKIPPLYDVVDVAALEAAFFGPSTNKVSDHEHRLAEFMYRGHRIVVRSDAWVQVYAGVEP